MKHEIHGMKNKGVYSGIVNQWDKKGITALTKMSLFVDIHNISA